MTNLDFTSSRARKARFVVMLERRYVRAVLRLCALVLLAATIFIVVLLSNPLGYLLLIPASPIIMLLVWFAGDLSALDDQLPTKPEPTIDELLEVKLLGRINSTTTVEQLIKIVGDLPGGRFYASRYAIASETLKSLVPPGVSLDAVWQTALGVMQSQRYSRLDGAVITIALVDLIPENDFYLAQLKIDRDDLVAGLDWFIHQQRIFASLKTKGGSGGIGRDFGFGWTPLLNKVGVNITEGVQDGILHREVEGRQEALAQMVHLLSQRGSRNVALVGENGVGKTTLVYALADACMNQPKKVGALKYSQIIELDAAHLISIAKGRGELEGLLIRLFNEAVHAKNVILFLDEAQLFLQDGVGSVDLSAILLQVLQGGALPMMLALSDQQWLQLSQQNASLAQAMNRVVVSPLNQDDTMRVMQDQILLMEGRYGVFYMFQSLREAYSLAQRYIQEQAFPGKAITLLEAASGFAEQKRFITEVSVQQAVEKNFDVKVQTASDSQERDMLLNLEGRIHERMINQTHAVKVVSDALRRARAGVRNQNRPIGTFLFLGPTGVGKTELSKALADIYFGGEDRLVRIDLNNYSKSDDATRLLEVGATNKDSLTAQIAKQPFSVVLLDEIEKAHPRVLDVLLQMLDEGVLRDSKNKPVSFRDAIIIATSNAGADKIRNRIEAGDSVEEFEEQFINDLIDANIFRPEFINRFDETILFRPLTVAELTQVVDLILKSINKTIANQRVAVALDQPAKEYLAQRGYDPRLGARPLRRVVQRSIENIVAQKLLANQVLPGATITITQSDIEAALAK